MSRLRTLAVLTLFLPAASAGATVLLPSDLGDLVRDAQTIARGRVVAVDAQAVDDRRTIETVVTLEVDAYLKGPLRSTLQFRVPGGSIGRYRRVFVGAPEFAAGDYVVVFLGVQGPGVPFVVGLSQGVFRLVPAIDRSQWLVTPPPIVPSAAGAAPIVRGDPARKPMPLSEFEQRVRALAGGPR